jgi:N-acetylmuramoyl-L-alanine amidase
MITKGFLAGMAAGALGLAVVSPVEASELRGVTLSSGADSAQVTLDLSDAAPQKLFTLEHPDRVVIDLAHTYRVQGVRPPPPSGVVSGVRFGTQPHGTLRIVVELRSALPAHTFWGSDPQGRRLVLNLGQPLLAAAVEAAPRPVRAAVVRAPVRAQHAPGEGERDVIVAVDAGHGGVDPGAIGHGGTREKDVTLAIARALAGRINAEPGMYAVLTRNRDEFLELRDRIARAHAAHADMFVSVHADSIADRGVSGASVYVLSAHGASSEAARLLAERENAADLMGGVLEDQGALRPVLLDAAQSEIIGLSATAAERVVSALGSVGEIRKAQVQQAGFVVLKSPDIPSMLVETAYISNPAEERRLRSAEQQARLAEAIASGVRSYFEQNPPDGTRFKQERRIASAAETATASATH